MSFCTECEEVCVKVLLFIDDLSVYYRYRCVETYPAQSEIELDLKIGDVIYVHKKRDDGWFKGTLQRSGKTGLFPGSFVEKVS
jgi:E3 ubiquitin-protein ligase SH3RF